MLFREFNVDKLDGWANRLLTGRQRWRRYQVRAVVRDSPEDAANVLRNLNYEVAPPPDGIPPTNTDMLQGR